MAYSPFPEPGAPETEQEAACLGYFLCHWFALVEALSSRKVEMAVRRVKQERGLNVRRLRSHLLVNETWAAE